MKGKKRKKGAGDTGTLQNTSAVYNGLFSVAFSTGYKYAARMRAVSEESWVCIKRER